MNAQSILEAIQAAVELRNKIQTAIAANAHVLPAKEAVPGQGDQPASPAQPATATGQLPTAAGFAHLAATYLMNHLANISTDEAMKQQAAAIVNTPSSAAGAQAKSS